jgi:hypothetical protein
MKTFEEIEKLKQDWSDDPCWDIETTEGFEDHTDELILFREKMNAVWEEKTRNREEKEMAKMGITDRSVYAQFKRLDFLIARLDERVEELEDK